MKPKLLVIELWRIGDLAIATPFLQAAAEKYDVTLLAGPVALELRPRLWPDIKVVPFSAPWTPMTGKYLLHKWPWKTLARIRSDLAKERFDVAVSGRWDPRDHVLMKLTGAKVRVGFPRLGSGIFLTRSLALPAPKDHHYENWRLAGGAIDVPMPPIKERKTPTDRASNVVLVHTGARLTVRVWPLDRYKEIIRLLRSQGYQVRVACDGEQRAWWENAGEQNVVTPSTIRELVALVDGAGIFIGNDSGPGHLAALCGAPTFTLFGSAVWEWWFPLHPQAEWIEGKACPYRPCADYCRFDEARCMTEITLAEAWGRIEPFTKKHLGDPPGGRTSSPVP